MERTVFTALILTVSAASAAKHVFVSMHLSWSDAQEYCRSHYTDLSPITNDVERWAFKKSVSKDQTGWVGLYWDLKDQKWKWSGGADGDNQIRPNEWLDTSEGLWWNGTRFFAKIHTSPKSFFCLNLIVVQEEKTWEEALDHCRENHYDFTSLLSETENLLAKNQIQDSTITQRVWVGLRFLKDTWMWANWDPLVFQNWNQTGDLDQQCPVWKRCGALTKRGEWENRDCEEKLHFICI
uniref:C-type lectin domain-containing protein n=1 Tax=Oryzias melastigma TaxID=30732 RepID=A0A3B3BT77_ORYME